MKRLIALLVLFVALSGGAIPWHSFPYGLPNLSSTNDTFLFGNATTNGQITAAQLSDYTVSNGRWSTAYVWATNNMVLDYRYVSTYIILTTNAAPSNTNCSIVLTNLPLPGTTIQGTVLLVNNNNGNTLCWLNVQTNAFLLGGGSYYMGVPQTLIAGTNQVTPFLLYVY